MTEDLKSVIAESLPADEKTVSSTEEQGEQAETSPAAHEEATSQKAEQEKQVPFHEHPRFKEIISERNELRERADRLERQLYEISSKIADNKSQSSDKDPYEGLTLEERAFWQKVESVAEQKAKIILEEKEKIYQKQITDTQAVQAAIIYKEFQKNHPDVSSNSSEERMIADKVRQGYDLEDAYHVVMKYKIIQKARDEALAKNQQKKSQQISQKQAANLESQETVALKPEKKLTVAEFVEIKGKELGLY